MTRLVTRCAILAVVIAGLTIAGCGGSSGPPGTPQPQRPGSGDGRDAATPPKAPPDVLIEDYELTDKVVIIGDDSTLGLREANGIRVVSQRASEKIVLQGHVPRLEPGDVLCSKIGELFVGKVLSVENIDSDAADGGQRVRVLTERPELADIYTRIYVKYRETMWVPEERPTLAAEQALSRLRDSSAWQWEWPIGVGGDVDVPCEEGSATAGAFAGVRLTVEFTLKVDYFWGFIPEGFTLNASAKVWAGAEVFVNATAGTVTESFDLVIKKKDKDHTYEGKEKLIAEVLLVKPWLDFYVGGQLEFPQAFDLRFEASVWGMVGVECTESSIDGYYDYGTPLEWPDPKELYMDTVMRPHIGLNPGMTVEEIFNLWAIVRLFGKLRLWTDPPTASGDRYLNIRLDLGIDLGLGVGIDVFGILEEDEDWTWDIGPWKVWQDKWLVIPGVGRKPRANIRISGLPPTGADPPRVRGAPWAGDGWLDPKGVG